MKIYFLSSKPCALTLNGAFYGVTDLFERFAELSLSDRVFAQFTPEGELPVSFFITEELLSTPPLGCAVYLLKEGIAVYAYDFPPADLSLRPVAQLREGEILATLFLQGKLQLHVQSAKGYFNATIPPSFASASLRLHDGLLLLESPTHLGVYTLEAEELLVERVTEYAFDGNLLTATLPLSDRLRRFADCAWTLTENACTLTKFSLREATADALLPDGLLAYAFFESVLLKADYASMLSDELKADGEKIVEFLGDFVSVTLTKEEKTCGLVRKKGERLFEVEYYSVEIEKGKITDVKG